MKQNLIKSSKKVENEIDYSKSELDKKDKIDLFKTLKILFFVLSILILIFRSYTILAFSYVLFSLILVILMDALSTTFFSSHPDSNDDSFGFRLVKDISLQDLKEKYKKKISKNK
ncbi:MAG: hypothetical protein GY714_07025 [Desulfobacterales bacterium]|nr:hypothetical protein [Desulfobacterales bacterium]MCP4162695.1 hypothetical protein [Deltaproteobacteria bacterium]